MPDAVRVSVSDVRREIYRASGYASGEGEASTEFLGTLFHRVFQAVMDPASEFAWHTVLDPENLQDAARLREHVYTNILGPRLRQNQAALQDCAQQVLSMWEATGHLCRHICQLLTNSVQQRHLRYDAATRTWIGLENFTNEQELAWLVQDPGWTAPVLVSGIVDATWHNPTSRHWCAIELKLGAGSSDADLAQLCLYHEMLRDSRKEHASSISLLHFQPELHWQQYSEAQIEPVKPKLRALIGKLAGLIPNGAAPTVDVPAPKPAHRELGARLVQVLAQFGPMVALESDPVVGPSFLRFHIMPKPGVKVNQVLPLGNDLAVQLRLEHPALVKMERGALVIDLQRPDRETLLFSEFRSSLPAGPNSKALVGIDLRRMPHFANLASGCPHILVAGTSGSGKSEWLLMALASLLATNTRQTLRVLLIDPKRATFKDLEHSPFLLDGPAMLYTPDEALCGLQRLIELMEERYVLLADHGCKDLASLQDKMPHAAPPRVVLFCDEYGNLVATKKMRENIEAAIIQLGAKARAAGIHLILATQDPRAQILTPALKANLDGRVCLRTTSSIQSRMMLEENGAESLLGNGDLLFKTVGEPIRLQAPLLEDADRRELFGAR